jgi:DNA-binding GntR family transcriptional regulator
VRTASSRRSDRRRGTPTSVASGPVNHARLPAGFLYRQVALELRRRITAHVYPSGAKIPSESELVNEFRVSAITVRRAIRDLAAEGLLFARQGLGVFVSDTRQIVRVFGSNPHTRMVDEMRRAGVEPSFKERSRALVPAEEEIATRLGLRRETLVYRHEKILLADGEPVALNTTYLPKRIGDLVRDELSAEFIIPALTAHGIQLDHTDYRFQAAVVLDEQSIVLGLPIGFPLLAVDYTVVVDTGSPLLTGRLLSRSDRFAYHFCARPDLHATDL